jgi:cyclopropane fatty-acyl-phospholipid synthase-like methyltransferase
MLKKPFASAAKENCSAILSVLRQEFKHINSVLEIGSGTGQHAIYFSQQLAHLEWQASDKYEMLAGINMWINESNLKNVLPAIELNVSSNWPQQNYQGAYAANIAHIMHWEEIEALFSGLDQVLTNSGVFCLYGPFNINGTYTSESNRRFDLWLKERDPESYIRDKNDLDQLAIKNNFQTSKQWDMPANNKILCWRRQR